MEDRETLRTTIKTTAKSSLSLFLSKSEALDLFSPGKVSTFITNTKPFRRGWFVAEEEVKEEEEDKVRTFTRQLYSRNSKGE